MDYSKAIKRRDKLETELKGIQWKIENSTKIRVQMQSWYYKKLDEYKTFLAENNLTPVVIDILQKPDTIQSDN